jgi:hypothetical protein
MKTLEYCIPEERKEALKEALDHLERGTGLEMAMMILSEPQGSHQNRPGGVTSKPANGR